MQYIISDTSFCINGCTLFALLSSSIVRVKSGACLPSNGLADTSPVSDGSSTSVVVCAGVNNCVQSKASRAAFKILTMTKMVMLRLRECCLSATGSVTGSRVSILLVVVSFVSIMICPAWDRTSGRLWCLLLMLNLQPGNVTLQ